MVLKIMSCESYMFVCFFFFKQKTAYELRISDWSSDVCSSDLVLRIGEGKTIEQRLADVGFAVAVSVLEIEDLRRIGHHDAFLPNHHAREIGRASCRERVCQYV